MKKYYLFVLFSLALGAVNTDANAVVCGAPTYTPTEAAAIYAWQECDTGRWHLRATAGGGSASFQGRLFTDGTIAQAIPVQLDDSDSYSAQQQQIDFLIQVSLNDQNGIDLDLSANSRLYLDITAATQNAVFLGATKERVEAFPVKLGGNGRQMNVVFIMTDDQRFDTLWAMPNVQANLVDHGVLFENTLVTTPLCCPVRASFLAGGLYDKNTGVYTNVVPTGTFALFDDSHNLGTVLQQAGYRTGLIGKVMNEYPMGYVMPGWSTLLANPGPGVDNWNAFTVTVGSSGALSSTKGTIIGPVNQYIGDYQRDRALEFISDASDKPFFLLLSTYAPHAPATPAAADAGLFSDYVYNGRGVLETDLSDKPLWVRDPNSSLSTKVSEPAFPAKQLRSLQAVDRTVKDIIDRLTALNKLDNTVIVFSSDNGYMWGEHGIWQKMHEYEESIRVPLVVRYPGVVPHVETKQVAMNLDVAATILDLANADFRTDGRSLIPLLHQPASSWREWELFDMYNLNSIHQIWAGIRTSEWKYVENAYGDQQLYDLATDPYELVSKHADPSYNAIKLQLKGILETQKGLAFTALPTPKLEVGTPYSYQLKAWGGNPPYAWHVVDRMPLIYLGGQRLPISDDQLPLALNTVSADCGAPQYAQAVEQAIFIWKDCGSTLWHIRATGGGSYVKFEGRLISDLPFTSLTPYNLNSADRLAKVGSNVEFMMQIWGAATNGLDFQPAAGANVRLDIDTHRLPQPLTLNAVTGVIAGTPDRLARRTIRVKLTDQSQRKIDAGPQTMYWDIPIDVKASSTTNQAPVITSQASLSTVKDTALTLTLSNLTVSDPDNVYPADFTLNVQTGTNYTIVGTTITPATGFTGTLTVPVTVNDGNANSAVFNLTVSVVDNASAPSPCGTPPQSPGTEAAVFLWKNCTTGIWSMRVTAGGGSKFYSGSVVSSQPFSTVTPVSIETNDTLNYTTDPRQIAYSLTTTSTYPGWIRFQFPGFCGGVLQREPPCRRDGVCRCGTNSGRRLVQFGESGRVPSPQCGAGNYGSATAEYGEGHRADAYSEQPHGKRSGQHVPDRFYAERADGGQLHDCWHDDHARNRIHRHLDRAGHRQ